jgi:hypothetical protein
MLKAPKFDVFGRIMIAEPTGDGWRLYVLGADGKRCAAAEIVVPSFVVEHELAQYLDDMFHEAATPEHPSVTPIST